MNYLIRKITEKDIPQVVELSGLLADHHHVIDKFWKAGDKTKKSFREFLKVEIKKSNTLWLVAEVDKKIVGYFSAEITVPKPVIAVKEIGHISSAFVIAEFRGKGISKMAIQNFFEWFKENGVKVVEITVDSRNVEGVRAWEGLGFKEYMKKMKLDL